MAYRRSHTVFRLLMPLIKERWLIEEVTSSSELLCAIAHDLEKKPHHLSETEDIQAEGQMKMYKSKRMARDLEKKSQHLFKTEDIQAIGQM